MASSQPTKRGKKLAAQNSVGTAATVSKFWTPPVIETVAYKDEKVICLYIDTWIRPEKITKTLVNSGAVVELISQKIV